MLKLDYDYIAYDELKRRVDFIKKYDVIKSIKIFQSPSCNGYHLYIETNKELNWNEKIKYRKLFKDDGQRIVLDLLKKEELKDVLFSLRYNNGIITREIFIEYYSVAEVKRCFAEKPAIVDKTNKLSTLTT
jgi:hypothetical protein